MSTVRRGNRGLGRGLGNLIPGSSEEEKAKTGETGTPESSKKSSSAKTGGTKSATKTTKAGTKAAQAKTGSKETAAKTGTKPSAVTGQVYIKVTDIEPNKEQPRKIFDENALTELAQSIKEVGVIQPIVVQKNGEFYKIIAGERRWRASKLVGLKEIPAVIKDYSDKEALEIALIENIQREDLNPIEEALAYDGLLKDYNIKQDELATRVSKSRSAISNSIRLLKLDPRVMDMISEGKISSGHGRALLGAKSKELQYELATEAFEKNLSVRDIEKKINDLKNPKHVEPKFSQSETFMYKKMEDRLKERLGSKVIIKRKDENKGKIEIDYSSKEEFERLYDLFNGLNK